MEPSIPQTVQAYELEDRELKFVTDIELVDLLDNIGIRPSWSKDITAALVSVKDGDYEEVWLTESPAYYLNSAPYHNRAYYDIHI